MKHNAIPLRYTVQTYRLDQFWLPLGFWGLFILLAWILKDDSMATGVAKAFLGGVPLMGGVLAAYAILDDPALELQFSAPRPAWRTLAERLGLILAILSAAALSYQAALAVIGIDLSGLGSLAVRQLAWLVPCLGLTALGCAAALGLAQPTFGALAVGLIWIFQLLAQRWFIHDPIARYFLLFFGITAPGHPDQAANAAAITALAALLIAAAWLLLKKQERYL